MLVAIACEMFGKSSEAVENAAVAIEIFHNFTLLHDDLMDDSPTRRNKPTVHVKWNANTAILSGDAMLIKAYEFLAKIPEKYWAKVLPVFTQTALEVCEGQQFDMDFETKDNVTIDEYFRMIRLKTAVLLACSLKTGAIIADASERDQRLIYDLGIAIGMAFQLKDDYLDTYGTFETLGKRIGDDILCRKKTFLLLTALNNADGNQREHLRTILNSTSIADDRKIAEVTEIYNRLNVAKICEEEINRYYSEAGKLLAEISVADEAKTDIRNLINKLKIREK
jgi:polyprenyl synthetase